MLLLYVLCYVCSFVVVDFFFFQAEDGIRDADVTGVQTCALPISASWQPGGEGDHLGRGIEDRLGHRSSLRWRKQRSEERRVGKECRSRWWRCHEKKKKEKTK